MKHNWLFYCFFKTCSLSKTPSLDCHDDWVFSVCQRSHVLCDFAAKRLECLSSFSRCGGNNLVQFRGKKRFSWELLSIRFLTAPQKMHKKIILFRNIKKIEKMFYFDNKISETSVSKLTKPMFSRIYQIIRRTKEYLLKLKFKTRPFDSVFPQSI